MKGWAFFALFLIAGCTVGPDYHAPDIKTPDQFAALTQNDAPLSQPVAQAVDISNWWMQFRDPELESLIGRALSANLDLLTAASRVREGRAQETVTGAAELATAKARRNT